MFRQMDEPKEAFSVLDGNFDLWLKYTAAFSLSLCPTDAHVSLEPLRTNSEKQEEEETKPVYPPSENTANSALEDSKQHSTTSMNFLC